VRHYYWSIKSASLYQARPTVAAQQVSRGNTEAKETGGKGERDGQEKDFYA